MKAIFTLPLIALILPLSMGARTFDAKQGSTKQVRATTENKVMFLNGANFDFSGKLAPNYVGHFNIFAPNISDNRWGFNTGIMKLNYFNNDTLQERNRIENILIDPLYPDLQAGDKYLRQLSKYSTVVKNSVWCFYAQPLFQLTSSAGGSVIYLHGHAELVSKKFNASTTITRVKADTMIYPSDEKLYVRADDGDLSVYKATSLNGYFGAGLTFNMIPYEKCAFFFQPTFGFTTDNPIEVNGATLATRSFSKTTDPMRGFYLVRAYFTQVVGTKATLNIGTDIRGILPRFDPLYAAYIGVNVNMEGVMDLFGFGGAEKKTTPPANNNASGQNGTSPADNGTPPAVNHNGDDQ